MFWWNSVTAIVDEEIVTWEDFKRRFQERFMSVMAQSCLIRQFAELVQGEMSIVEYARKFEELARYGYASVDTVLKRNEKFIRGLKPELASATLSHLRNPSGIVVEMVVRQEEVLESLEKSRAKGV